MELSAQDVSKPHPSRAMLSLVNHAQGACLRPYKALLSLQT